MRIIEYLPIEKRLHPPIPQSKEKTLVKNSLSIFKSYQKAMITKEFGVICAPSRSCMLDNMRKKNQKSYIYLKKFFCSFLFRGTTKEIV